MEKIVSVCRAFNCEHFDNKKFLKRVYFDGEKVEILWSPESQLMNHVKKGCFQSFFNLLHDSKVENEIQDHIWIPCETAHRTVLIMNSACV